MNQKQDPEIQIVMPVHNEEDCIESVITEIYNEISSRLPVEFIICEDGSKDKTKDILQRLSREIPMKLNLSDDRKGYSQAVIDGFKSVTSDYALAVDSDGQCFPGDFWKFYEQRKGYDVLIGWRKPRNDTFSRRFMSGTFKVLHKILFRVPIHDPSCPFLLVKRKVLGAILNDLGILKQGFWWEFIAHVYCRGFTIKEIPIQHRARSAGTTKVYHLNKMPKIVSSHVLGLFRIWWQVRKS